MSKFKRGKYVGAEFTSEQKLARKLWREANRRETLLSEALMTCNTLTRKQAHKRLDRVFDTLDVQRRRALDLFPDVDESFTISSFTMGGANNG